MTTKETNVDVKQGAGTSAPAHPEPWAPMSSLRDEFERMFDDFGAGLWRWPSPRTRRDLRAAADQMHVVPAMEIVERDGGYQITAELPGMDAENVDIKLTDGMITIRGEKTEEKKEENEGYLLSERRYGSFHRSLPLPSGVDADAVSASYTNGVLTVTLPKTAEAKQKERKVEVKAA